MKGDRLPQRPPAFTYVSGRPPLRKSEQALHADKVAISSLAKRFGTPLYVYSATAIRERYRIFDSAFAGIPHTVCYSVKANSNLSILRLLANLRAGFDIVSGGELQRVITAARSATRRVVFSGVGKLVAEIDQAIQAGILLFNVESESELELLAARAAHLNKRADFAIRVNPDVAADTHPYIATGLHQHKFGVLWRDASTLYRQGAEKKQLRACGVSVHIGSQISDIDAFAEAMKRVATLVRALRAERHDIQYVDAGGGLAIPYSHTSEDFPAEVRRYSEAIMRPLRNLDVHLLLEPGRAIVAPAGALITRVLYRKRNNGKKFLVVDAAMNDLLRPALYDAHHEIVPVLVPSHEGGLETVDIVGPVCESGDFFARKRKLSRAEEGELLAVLDAGAYGMSLASNYNTRPRPAEVLVDGKQVRLIRKRETVADLLAPERE